MTHPFIFTPGEWLGEGTIRFTESPEEMLFYTRWVVSEKQEGVIACLQEIEVEGVPDAMSNAFFFSEAAGDTFAVQLDNSVLGIIEGEGVVDDSLLSWEFRGGQKSGFEGFEIYEVQGERYKMHGEYASIDQLRTLIQGELWRKGS